MAEGERATFELPDVSVEGLAAHAISRMAPVNDAPHHRCPDGTPG